MSKENETFATDGARVAQAVEQVLVGACIKYDQAAVIAGAMSSLATFIAVAIGSDPLTPKKLSNGKMQSGRDFAIEIFTENLDQAIEFLADKDNLKQVHKAYADIAKEVVGVVATSRIADALKEIANALKKSVAETKPKDATVH